MSLRTEMLALLDDPGINFTMPANGSFPAATVNAALFRRVRTAVEGYTVPIIVDPTLLANMAPCDVRTGEPTVRPFDAVYQTGAIPSVGNRFVFSGNSLAGVHQRALAIHESVHAGFDLNSVTIWAVDDEAASYLAQCVYLLRNSVTAAVPPTPIFTAAFAAASSIVASTSTSTSTSASASPAPTAIQLAALRTAIQNEPLYQNIQAPGSRRIRNG